METLVKITSKGQITIPKEIRELLGTDMVVFKVVKGKVLLEPVKDVGGIFKNNLNKYYVHLTEREFNRCVNKNVIEQMEKVDKIFVNSNHTLDLLKKYTYNRYLI